MDDDPFAADPSYVAAAAAAASGSSAAVADAADSAAFVVVAAAAAGPFAPQLQLEIALWMRDGCCYSVRGIVSLYQRVRIDRFRGVLSGWWILGFHP